MIKLLPDEKIITESEEQQVVLTTHRICYECKRWDYSYNQSIMLEHITSCEIYIVHRYSLLFIATGLLILSSFISKELPLFWIPEISTFLAVILGLTFWFTQKSLIIISSPSTKIKINVIRMKREQVLSFVNNVEQTKHKRLTTLNNKVN